MKAVVFHGIGDIRLDDVPEPKIQEPTDAVVRLTSSAICGTELHMIRGTMAGMKEGTILGHEGVGIVEEVGPQVRNLNTGDRVVIGSTAGCGYCSYCRADYFAQCDNANPNGPQAGTAFFGGPETTGPIDGMQAEYARVPYASVTCIKLPENVSDEQAIMIRDIFPTGYFGADIADVSDGDTVAVFGCGPVGQFAITSAFIMGAGRVFAVDRLPDRLEMAKAQGAEVVNFDEEDPVGTIQELIGGIGTDRVIEAVGVDAEAPGEEQFEQETDQVAPETNPQGGQLASRRRPLAIRPVGDGGRLQGRDHRRDRGLPAAGDELPRRGPPATQPHSQGRQLQPSPLHPQTRRPRCHGRRGPHGDTHPEGTGHRGHRSVRSFRPAPTRLDQGRAAPRSGLRG